MLKWLGQRSTGEILVLLVGATICGYVVVSGTFIIVLALTNSKTDISDAARNISDIINTLIGLLAGFLAGRTATGPTPDEAKKARMEEKREDPPTE